MEFSKIDLKEFYHRGKPSRKNLEVDDLLEESIKKYEEITGCKLFREKIPKGISRQVLKRYLVIGAVYNMIGNTELMDEVIRKLVTLNRYDRIISGLHSGIQQC